MDKLQQPRILLVQPQPITLAVDGLNALEEILIEIDRVHLASQHGPNFSLQLAQRVIGICICDVAKNIQNLVQRPTGDINRDDCVLECRRVRIVDNGINVRTQLQNRLLRCRHVMPIIDFGEGWYAIVGRPLLTEWITCEFLITDDNLRQPGLAGGRLGCSGRFRGFRFLATGGHDKGERSNAAREQ